MRNQLNSVLTVVKKIDNWQPIKLFLILGLFLGGDNLAMPVQSFLETANRGGMNSDNGPNNTETTSLEALPTDKSFEPGAPGLGQSIYLPIISNFKKSNFFYGAFDSAGFVGSPAEFERYIQDWQSHGFDSALVINAVPPLSVSDRMYFNIIASPLYDLYRQWFFYENYHNGAPLCNGNVTIDCARTVIGPIVDPIKSHPSVNGYYIFDDATPKYNERLRLATQVFQERDTVNPASPGLLPGPDGIIVYRYTNPQAFITYDYPVRNSLPVCDFSEGYHEDWVDRARQTMQEKPMSVPFWTILQAHGSPTNSLRTPTVEEVRLLNWLALGEDAKGIFWFSWTTDPDQFWTGIRDNPALLTEISDLARRVNILQPYLSIIRKVPDKFQVSPFINAYVSTLKDVSTGKLYVIAANHSCSAQNLTLTTSYFDAQLKDLETGSVFDLGTALQFRGGDGKLFEVINAKPLPPPVPQANLVQNPSFELDGNNNSIPDNWGNITSANWDTTVAHSGRASLKVSGPSATVTSQAVTLKPNTKYYASWYMKAQNLVDSHLGFEYWQLNPKQTNLEFVMWNQNGSYDWVKRIGFFQTPSDYVTGKINIGWDVKSGSTYWVDDVTLCEVGLPCPDVYLGEREPN